MSENSKATEIAKAAKSAFEASQLVDSSERVKALSLIKSELEALRDEIQKANKEDMEVRRSPTPNNFSSLIHKLDTKSRSIYT